MANTHDKDLFDSSEALASPDDLCAEWKTKWRAIAVSAQSILRVLFPPAANVIGILITIADGTCGA